MGISTIQQVMDFGLLHNWSSDQVIEECKRRFRNVRGLTSIREHYDEMRIFSDAPRLHDLWNQERECSEGIEALTPEQAEKRNLALKEMHAPQIWVPHFSDLPQVTDKVTDEEGTNEYDE